MREALLLLGSAYCEAAERLRAGDRDVVFPVVFPEDTCPPGLPFVEPAWAMAGHTLKSPEPGAPAIRSGLNDSGCSGLRFGRRRATRLLWILLLIISCTFAMDILVRNMLYPAPTIRVPEPPPPPLEELVLISSEGDRMIAWLNALDDGPAVLFLHGNGENLETLRRVGLFEEFRRLGASVLAVDYPGYGRSSGKPSESGLIAGGRAGFQALAERFPTRPKFIVGWSLGAAVAVQTAVPHQAELAGQIFLSAWHDLPTVASKIFPEILVRIALRDRYLSGGAADDLTVPTLVIHGELDRLIPVDQGRRLFERLPAGSRFVGLDGVGHNDLMGQPTLWREIANYLAASDGFPPMAAP